MDYVRVMQYYFMILHHITYDWLVGQRNPIVWRT